MKKSLLTIAAVATAAVSLGATSIVPLGEKASSQAKVVQEYTRAIPMTTAAPLGSAAFDPYYPAPDGALYLGLGPKAERSGSLFVLAPLDRPMTFKSGFSTSDGDYTWDYTDTDGKSSETDNKDITITYTAKKAYDAPYLYCIGYGGRGGYSCAKDGIAAGYGSLPSSTTEFYGSNLDVDNLVAQFYDPTTLSVNYPDANTNLLKYYKSAGISALTIKGFAESFAFGGDYALDAVRADMVYADGTSGTTDHFVARVYPMDDKGNVDFGNLIVTMPATSVTKHDNYFYNFEFTPAEAPRITSPIMIVFAPTDACTSIVSPAEYALEVLHDADKGTAYMYASYKFGETEVEDGILAYSGVELEGRYTYYHNHWNVSIKRTYLEDLPRFSQAYGYQMGDTDGRFGFVNFPTNDPSSRTVTKSVSSSLPQVGAGEYAGGVYYAFTLYQDYLYGDGLATDAFVAYDPADDYAELFTLPLVDAPRVADMAFDYTTNTMYALVEQNKDDAGRIGLTYLSVVDLNTGRVATVGEPGDIRAQNGNGRDVEEHLIALAASPEGVLYAMGEYRQLYTLDPLTGAATAVGTRDRVAVMNDFQTMAFNKDGQLFYAQNHPDYEYFTEIDPADGKRYNPVTGEEITVNSDFTNNACRVAGDPQITGLYFADRDINPAAPQAVEALAAVLRQGTHDKVDLEWTLPTENFGKAPAGITSVKVFRYGTSEAIATLPASTTSFSDGQAPSGTVTYAVVAYAGEAAGFPAYATVFAGHDQLNSVDNLTATLEGDDLTLAWDAPTTTVNGGYADYDNITYVIHRLSGDARHKLTDSHAETTYAATHSDPGTFSFEVVPVSGGIEGVPAVSNEVVKTASAAAAIPYKTSFEDDGDGQQWTITNKSTGSYGWSIIKGYAYQQYDGKFAQFKTGGASTIPTDDLFGSPAIAMPAGDYILSYYACGGSYDTHTWKVYLSDTPDATGQLLQSVDNQKVCNQEAGNVNNYQLYEVPFSVADGGNKHIVFQGIGAATYATLKIDNLAVDKSSAVDGVAADAVATISYDATTSTVTAPGATQIEVYSLQGALVARADGPALTITAAKGVYVVKATTPAATIAVKVAVK